jgi:hypothetical protein
MSRKACEPQTMRTITHQLSQTCAVEIVADEPVLADVPSTLDLLASVGYEQGCQSIIVHQEDLPAAFFDLQSGLLGEILLKFSTYRFSLAVIGDFSAVKSRALADFIRESNRKREFVFASTIEEVIQTFWN